MSGLKCSEAEAREIYAADRAVEHGKAQDYDLPPEKIKIAQQFCHTGTRKPTAYKFTKRERKPNATKAGIIANLQAFLQENPDFVIENVQILNKERQISFQIGDETYELTLVQKRKPKK